jgi:thiol-disulfide isomerase/thioredoxin
MSRRPLFALLSVTAALIAVFAVSPVSADPTDPRGWTEGGTMAANTGNVIGGVAERPELPLPDSVARFVKKRPTLLVYFSPTCPHCRAVQPELTDFAGRMRKKIDVVGIAGLGAHAAAVEEYVGTFDVPYRIIVDSDRSIGQAMGVRGTPSALLVERDGDVVRIVQAWYPYVPGSDSLVEMFAGDGPWAAFRPGEYHGTAVCASCHVEEAESWQLTHHSKAWWTLLEREDQDDPECTGCHVVGAGQPGGWTPEGAEHLVDVGCEACHSAGGPHDGERVEPRDTCEGCHDDKHSIAFSLREGAAPDRPLPRDSDGRSRVPRRAVRPVRRHGAPRAARLRGRGVRRVGSLPVLPRGRARPVGHHAPRPRDGHARGVDRAPGGRHRRRVCAVPCVADPQWAAVAEPRGLSRGGVGRVRVVPRAR